jgi:hypothetical protein
VNLAPPADIDVPKYLEIIRNSTPLTDGYEVPFKWSVPISVDRVSSTSDPFQSITDTAANQNGGAIISSSEQSENEDSAGEQTNSLIPLYVKPRRPRLPPNFPVSAYANVQPLPFMGKESVC